MYTMGKVRAALVIVSVIVLMSMLAGCNTTPSSAQQGSDTSASANATGQSAQSASEETAASAGNGKSSESDESVGSDASETNRAFPSPSDVAKSFGSNVGSRNGYRVFHVRTADFQFDLPEYWRGKVEWFERRLSNGHIEVSICPIGMTRQTSSGNYECALVHVRSTDASARVEGGDIGGGLVAHVDGSDKDVVAYQRNWTFIGREGGPDARPGSQKYSKSELDKLIDLATGGKLGYADCKNTSNDMACMSYNKSQFDGKIKVGNYGNPSMPSKTANEYIMPDTDTVAYNVRIWNDMDNHKLFLVRNEIFARHGCGFKSQELRDYFGKQAWYKETVDAGTYDASILSSAEKKNANAILDVEKQRNSPYV